MLIIRKIPFALLIIPVLLNFVGTASAMATKPVAIFSVQAVSSTGDRVVGDRVAGTIYSDGSAKGHGSFNVFGTGVVLQISLTHGDWDPITGVLFALGTMTDPRTKTSSPLALVITGLVEGHNDIMLFYGRYIVEVHSVP